MPTKVERCKRVSEIDDQFCLKYAGHVGRCQFTDDEVIQAPEQLPTVSSAITKAADPNAPRDPEKPQSDLQHRFDLIDAPALFEMTGVLYTGAKKYGDDSWRRIPVQDHLNHLLAHVYAYLAGDRSDDHLSNVMCRAMFAQGKALRPNFLGKMGPLDEA